MGYVYLFLETDKNGDERFKIGITKNPIQERISQLQTGNSNVITLLNFYKSKHYKNIERMLHNKFVNQKTEAKNEWFELTDEQIKNFLMTCEELEKRVILLKENNPFYK